MPRRVPLFVAALAALAALALAACGGSDNAAAPTTAASAAPTSAAVTTAAVTSALPSTSTTNVEPTTTTHAPTTAPTTHTPTTVPATTASTAATTTAAATTSPPTTAATSTVAAGTSPQGFGTIGITIRAASGAAKSFCLWLADTEAKRERGLMQVTSLGGRSGMLFAFEQDTQGAFWMFQTVMPLSIAFFDSSGTFVSSTDMAPCTGTSDTCSTYAAAARYRDAIEVPQGGLGALGIGPGSALTDRGSCPA
jgi:uncharacterized protein